MPLAPALVLHGANVSSVAPLHFLGQVNWNEMQQDHVTPLPLASHDIDGIINGIIAFLR